jgi:predicted kinase
MTTYEATLHLLCGKIAAGKSTLTAELGTLPNAVVVREDEWLSRLYPDEMVSVQDYVRCSARLRNAMAPHLVSLLKAGVTVVLDFPANTLLTRQWMRMIVDEAKVRHELHYLDVPDDICRARLRARNASGEHEFAASDEQFDVITKHFVPPTPDEGFNVVVHRP